MSAGWLLANAAAKLFAAPLLAQRDVKDTPRLKLNASGCIPATLRAMPNSDLSASSVPSTLAYAPGNDAGDEVESKLKAPAPVPGVARCRPACGGAVR